MSKDLTLGDEKDKQTKAIWDDVTLNTFIQVCVVETLDGNRPNCHFNKIGWKNLIKNFNEKTGRNYGYRELKNKWTTLKKDWQIWNDLVGVETGLGWDHLRQTIDATNQWWEDKLKVIPEAAKYRAKGLQNVDQLDILFKDIAVTGEGAWAPSQGFVVKAASDRVEGYIDDTIGETEVNENEYNNNVDSTTANDVDTTSEAYTLGREKKRKATSSKVGSSKMTDKLDRLCDVIEYRRRDLPRCNIFEVMDTLMSLSGIVEGDELYMKATEIFTKRENREMFVAVQKSETKIEWLKQKKV